MSQGTSVSTRSSCGCGGTTPARTTGKGCGCGIPECGGCEDQGFLRPRFFAGQLLTEDDLELLGSYVTSKNRLHNRHFFGDGVVCGLDVLCHPCDPGFVRVQPGYALDCCGNDIVVNCEVPVDILALARQLGGRISSYGCSEPCPPPARPDMPDKGAAVARESGKKPAAPLEPPQRYCLYIRYCETPTDPTTPYQTNDPCGVQGCETTRVREGYRFELECRTDDPPRPDIVSTFTGCLGDLVRTNRVVGEVLFVEGHALYLDPALDEARRDGAIAFTAQHQQQLVDGIGSLQAWTSGGGSMTRERLLEGARLTEVVSGLYLRYHLAPAPAAVDGSTLDEAIGSTSSARVVLESELSGNLGLSGPEAGWVRGVAEVVPRLHDLGAAAEPTPMLRFLAQGRTWTRSMQNAYIRALIEVRELLLEHLTPGVSTTDCTLRSDVLHVQLPPVRGGEADSVAEIGQVLDGADRLVGSLLRHWLDCLCRALNPPCAPCEDERVLLACLDVKDCEVASICSTERRWVITGPSLRYWLPPLNALGDLLEKACCAVRGTLISQGSLESFLAYLGFQPVIDDTHGGVKMQFNQARAVASLGQLYSAQGVRQVAELPLATSRITELAGTRIGIVRPAVFEPRVPVELEEIKEAGLPKEELLDFIDKRVLSTLDARAVELVDAKIESRGNRIATDAAKIYLEREAPILVAPVVERIAAESIAPARAAAAEVFAAREPELVATARAAAADAVSTSVAPQVRKEFDAIFTARAPAVLAAALGTEAGRSSLDAVITDRVASDTTRLTAELGEVLSRLDSVEKKANSVAGSLGGHTVTTNRLREAVDRAATAESVAVLERDNAALRERITAMGNELAAIKRRLEA